MAFDYTTLIAGKTTSGSVQSWVNSDKVPAADVVADTENWLSKHLRVRRMQERAALTLDAGDSEIDLSSELPNFLDPIRLHMNGYGDLLFIPEDDIDRVRAADSDGTLSESAPSYWTLSGAKLLFDCEADDDYSLILIHYAKPTALSADNTTNLYTDEWRATFKFAAMGFAYVFLKDEQRATAMFNAALALIEQGKLTDGMARRGMSFDVEVA